MEECLQLGRALRYGDAESFFQVYDRLLQDSTASDHDVSTASTLKAFLLELFPLYCKSLQETLHSSSLGTRSEDSILLFSSWTS